MDRLSVVSRTPSFAVAVALAWVLAMAACRDQAPEPEAPAPGEGRVNAVMANNKHASFADLCDIAPAPGSQPFHWPALSEAAPPVPSTARYRWVNVWATWCKPCIEELPLLKRTFDAWKKEGREVALTLLSIDDNAQVAKSFIAAWPGFSPTLQLKDPSKASDWLSQVGLAAGAAIPVHNVLDDKGNLLCARAGGMNEAHLQRMKHVLFP